MLNMFRGTESTARERFVYHAAGFGGYGGSSYIDSVVLRERDANSAEESTTDGTLEQRRYYCQNWRADVSAILTDLGKLVENVKYSSYGVPTCLPAGDADSDGDYDATDAAAIGGTYTILEDADLDGDSDANDVTWAGSITRVPDECRARGAVLVGGGEPEDLRGARAGCGADGAQGAWAARGL
jgi:hypothetical protein